MIFKYIFKPFHKKSYSYCKTFHFEIEEHLFSQIIEVIEMVIKDDNSIETTHNSCPYYKQINEITPREDFSWFPKYKQLLILRAIGV